jgi:hypothetical protein
MLLFLQCHLKEEHQVEFLKEFPKDFLRAINMTTMLIVHLILDIMVVKYWCPRLI